MPDELYLTPAQVARLNDEDLARYLAVLEHIESTWLLTPKQQEAEDLALDYDELLYGGAAGGGKTDWMLYHAYGLSQRHRKHRTLALRRTFPQLRDSLILRSKEKFSPDVARWRAADKEWEFRDTGSTIRFGFCDNEDDVRHYLSTEYDLIVFEELTEFTKRQYMLVRSRNRTTATKRALGIRPHTIAATNPGQVGHQWVKERFVASTDYGTHPATVTLEHRGRKRDVTVAFVQAKVADNPHIDPDYVFNLMQLPDVERRQYLDGDWDVFAGQYFPEFSRDKHVVPPFTIPAGWARIRAVDYGFGNPFCCLWIAFDHDGNAWVYRERYGAGLTATAQGRTMRDSSTMFDDSDREVPEVLAGTYADPSIWSREGSGLSIAAQYRDEGVVCRKAMNKRIDGWSRVRDWLRGDGTPDGGSKVRIFDTCPNLIRTMPEMVFDKDKPEDLDTHLEDHAVDALRYGLATRAPRPRKRRPTPNEGDIDRDLDRIVEQSRRGPRHPVLGRL